LGGCVPLLQSGLRREASRLLNPPCASLATFCRRTPPPAQCSLPWRVHALTTPQFATPLDDPTRISSSSAPKGAPLNIRVQVITRAHTAMHDNGTAKLADDRKSTHVISQAVRGISDLPARALGAAATPPQRPTDRAMDAPSRLQPVPTSARSSASVRGRENGQVDLIDLVEIGSSRWEQ